ncbi:MAG: divalent-cation tolerance protein CutA [Proteobacteria bacterium]|nr:divalent-cation tolerance protein CutA [Pseudomonadota bacterium]
MTKHVTVFMTAPDEGEAGSIAKKLVEERLCACVNIVPKVRSIYRWQGEICDEPEVMMIAKTEATLSAALVSRVKELHSYEVPEIICLPIQTGSGEYLDWIAASVDAPAKKEGELEL